LTVHELLKDDVYHDRVRIPELSRGGIKEARICKLSARLAGKRVGEAVLVEVRGDLSMTSGTIRIDDITRIKLAVKPCEQYTFTLRTVWWIGQFWWAWNASDPTPRIAARLGLLGLLLGLAGLVIGVIPLFRLGGH
jgi:hypothetical protein